MAGSCSMNVMYMWLAKDMMNCPHYTLRHIHVSASDRKHTFTFTFMYWNPPPLPPPPLPPLSLLPIHHPSLLRYPPSSPFTTLPSSPSSPSPPPLHHPPLFPSPPSPPPIHHPPLHPFTTLPSCPCADVPAHNGDEMGDGGHHWLPHRVDRVCHPVPGTEAVGCKTEQRL